MPSHAGHPQGLCVGLCMEAQALQSPEVSGSLELELQAVVSLLLGAGIQRRLSGREVGVLKC